MVSEGVITQDAADRILGYYSSKSYSKISILIILFGILGASLVGGGIILILAHNWDDLARPIRIVISLLPLLTAHGFGAYVIAKKSESVAWRESVGTAGVMAVGISISLVSQTYNIYGDLERFILAWTLLSLPIAYILDAAFPAILYIVGVGWWSLLRGGEGDIVWLYYPLIAAIVPYGVTLFRSHPQSVRFRLLVWTAVLFFIITYWSLYPEIPKHNAMSFSPGFLALLGYATLFSILYMIGSLSFYESQPLLTNPALSTTSMGIPLLMFIYTFLPPWERLVRMVPAWGAKVGAYGWCIIIHTVILIACAMALLVFHIRKGRRMIIPLASSFLLFILGYALMFINSHAMLLVNQIVFNCALLALGIFTVVWGAMDGRLGRVNYGMIIIAILVICRFFDVDISFVTRGLVFIMLGAGFLTVNAVILRRRRHS